VLIGTSDLKIDHPDDVRCTEEEVDYFIGMLAKVFPSIKVTREHIVFRFSGVRPLPAQDAATTGQISRDHSIRVMEADSERPFPILSLVGGKWTSFRAFAEQAANDTLARLGRTRTRSTRDLPIGGGDQYPSTAEAQRGWVNAAAAEYSLPPSRMQTLFDRYGSRAQPIAAACAANDDQPLTHRADYSTAEIRFLIQMEKIVYLDDLILRRTLIGMLGRLTLPLLQELCAILAAVNGWDDARRQAEENRTAALLAEHHQLIFN
jgi:glycerol-3-phosphate dehydrogenase